MPFSCRFPGPIRRTRSGSAVVTDDQPLPTLLGSQNRARAAVKVVNERRMQGFLTSEREKANEVTKMKKAAEKITNVNHAISAMQPKLSGLCAKAMQPPAAEHQQMSSTEEHPFQMPASIQALDFNSCLPVSSFATVPSMRLTSEEHQPPSLMQEQMPPTGDKQSPNAEAHLFQMPSVSDANQALDSNPFLRIHSFESVPSMQLKSEEQQQMPPVEVVIGDLASQMDVTPLVYVVPSSSVALTKDNEVQPCVIDGDDAELRELERRVEELRSAMAEKMRRRRKRELEAEIEALQKKMVLERQQQAEGFLDNSIF